MSSKIIRKKEVCERIGICGSSLYDYIQKGKFPRQISLGNRSVGWLESEIENWIAERAEQRGQ